MLNRRILAVASALVVTLGLGLEADTRQSQAPHSPAAATTQESNTTTTVHLEGCVFPKRALTETGPIIVPVGSQEDYLLTDTKVISAAPGVDRTEGRMFQLTEVAQDRLRTLVGQRVGVTGHIEDKPEYAQMVVTGIREISGSCPYRPTMHP